MTRMIVTASTLFLAGALVGCGHGRMVPAPSAQTVPEARMTAYSTTGGVRCAVSGDSWRGFPRDLTESVTPIKVRIRNNSGKPVRVLYQQFALVGSSGHTYHPRPIVPIDAGKQQAFAPVRPAFTPSNFYVAQKLGKLYETLEPWSSPLPRDQKFYKRQYRAWDGDLPTRDMMAQALPEGVLADEGVVSGFLYFQNATADEDQLVFRAEMSEGDSETVVADIQIPFRVE